VGARNSNQQQSTPLTNLVFDFCGTIKEKLAEKRSIEIRMTLSTSRNFEK
jgi:hypothetical protein